MSKLENSIGFSRLSEGSDLDNVGGHGLADEVHEGVGRGHVARVDLLGALHRVTCHTSHVSRVTLVTSAGE